MFNLILLLWLGFSGANSAVAAERYSTWKKEQIIDLTIQYIADTKAEFARRAAAVKAETGEVVDLDYQYLHNPVGEAKKEYDKFVAKRLSTKVSEQHMAMFLKDLERVRQKLATAEKKAFASWAKKPLDLPIGEAGQKKAELFGQTIESRRMGAILDNSPSMKPYLDKLREELASAFPDYRYLEVWGSFLRLYGGRDPGTLAYRRSHDGFEPWHYAKPRPDQNPFDARFFNPRIPAHEIHYFVTGLERDNLSAIRALVELEGVDAIYWFCDMDDTVDKEAVAALDALLKKHKAKLFLHTLKRAPSRALREVAEDSGGAVIRKRIR